MSHYLTIFLPTNTCVNNIFQESQVDGGSRNHLIKCVFKTRGMANNSSTQAIDWALCLICQATKGKKEKLRGTEDGRKTLAKLLPLFAEKGLFNISKFQCVSNKEEDVKKKFDEKQAKYHKSCYLQYNQKNLDRFALTPPSENQNELDEEGPSLSK